MAWLETPQGVTFTRQQTEYQHFPEEFFSGADVVVYFGDVWVADVTSLSFALVEQARPVYGYASYTWDVLKRGTRLVQGRFGIAFREAGYLYRILDHLGQLGGQAAPALAHMLAGEGKPKWQAEALQTIEELLGGDLSPSSPVRYVLIRPGEYEVVKASGQDRAIMPTRDLGQRLGVAVGWNAGRKAATVGDREFPPYKLVNGTAWLLVRQVAEALGYAIYWDRESRYIVLAPAGAKILGSDKFTVVGDRALIWSRETAALLGIDQADSGRFKVDETGVYLNGRRFERVDVVPGKACVYVREVFQAFNYTVDWIKEAHCIVLTPAGAVVKTTSPSQPSRYYKDLASYEAEIWGEALVPERAEDRHFKPYFYSGENMAPLTKYGFDIYIVYGPLPYHVKERLNRLPELVTYDTTVKAIRNVQLVGCSQLLDPTGRPVEEVYEFIARDLN